MSPSTSTSTNSYPFKDALFSFISSLDLCVDECAVIRKTRHGADTSSSLRSLKRYLASYSAALSDEYNYHHTGLTGSKIETGDQAAIFDVEKCTSQLRTYILAPLHEVAVRRTGPYKPESGFGDLKDTAVAICDDVLRVIEYLVERLSRKSRPEPVERKRDSYTPPYIPSYDPYYQTAPAPRPIYAPESSYYGVRPPLYAPPQPQPKYVAVRDAYGGVVLVRSHRHRG